MTVLLSRTASLIGYPELVEQLGGDARQLLKQAGIDPESLHDLDQMITSESLARLLDLSAEQLSCPCFGLMLSQGQGISILGPVGLIMRQSPTLLEAVSALQKYLHLHSEIGTFTMQIERGLATVEYATHVTAHDHCRQVADLALGVGCNLIRLYCGTSWRPRAAYFRHGETPDLTAYTLNFRCPLSFLQDFNGFVFDASILSARVNHAEPDMQQFLGNYLDRLQRGKKSDLVHQLSILMRNALLSGQCTVAYIAQQLGFSERALQRRLKAKGTSFQTLLTQLRKELAQEYLAEGGISLSELSQRLGYAELSVFSRSYKRWFGVAPSRNTLSSTLVDKAKT